jgi:hypothetical protein
MDFRYGIHTMELFHRLSQKSFNKVFQHLKSLHFGKPYPDVTYHSDKGIEKYICTSYCGQGVVLYLYKQKRSKNKTSKNIAYSIRFRLNPHTLLHGRYSPKKVFTATEKQLKTLDREMTELLHKIGLDREFEQLTLSRIDCCLDYFPESQKWVDEALRVIRCSPYMKQYKLCTFGKEFPNHKEKNAHSWCICCKTTTLTVYDKTFQLMEEDLLEQYDAPMLRFEVSRSGAKFKRGLSDEVKGSNKEILKTVINESEKTIHSYKELQRYSEKYKIPPEQDQCGSYVFQKVKFCKLHNYIYKEQKNSKFSSAPYCSFYVPPREMYMLLLNLVIFLCYLRKCRNIFLYGMECPRFITVNITPICVQNRLPRKRFRLLFIMPTRKHKGRRTTIADGPPAVWGKKRCQMRSMM